MALLKPSERLNILNTHNCVRILTTCSLISHNHEEHFPSPICLSENMSAFSLSNFSFRLSSILSSILSSCENKECPMKPRSTSKACFLLSSASASCIGLCSLRTRLREGSSHSCIIYHVTWEKQEEEPIGHTQQRNQPC